MVQGGEGEPYRTQAWAPPAPCNRDSKGSPEALPRRDWEP